MPNLRFRQLLVISNSAKSANQFQFQKLTLITANNNSVGKSTLAKLLFWGFGCETEFDTTWKGFDCSTIIKFTIDEKELEIKRYKNNISLKENGVITNFPKITGDFSNKFADLVGFKALLPNQSTGELETPPPAYYFLPFYIDQKRSWSKAWDNFDNLAQYKGWKNTIIKYHVGLLTSEYFDLEIEKSIKKNKKNIISSEIAKIDSTLEIVEDYLPSEKLTTVVIDDFNNLTEEITKDLKNLTEKQESFLDVYSSTQVAKSQLEHQKQFAIKLIEELDKDYVFAVENILEDHLTCPLCGTMYQNSIFEKSSILQDKGSTEIQLEQIEKDINKANNKLSSISIELNKIRLEIDRLNSKYIKQNVSNEDNFTFVNLIESIGGQSIKKSINESRNTMLGNVKDLTDAINLAKKSQKKLYTPEDIEDIEADFNKFFSDYIKVLDAQAVNLSEINSSLSYNKIVKEGGAAENSRAILAYYIAIFSMVSKYKNEVVSPLVIDTPNQQEQSDDNYSNIIKLIQDKIPRNNQIIICAMSNPKLIPLEEKAHIIELGNSKLLDNKQYAEIKQIFDTW